MRQGKRLFHFYCIGSNDIFQNTHGFLYSAAIHT